MMDNELRDILHRRLEERGSSNIGISMHQYLMLDSMGELVRKLVDREVQRLKWREKDDA